MEAGYTNVKPGDQTIKNRRGVLSVSAWAVTAGTKENAVKAEFEDYNAQNGQFTSKRCSMRRTAREKTKLQPFRGFTLTGQNGRTYTVKVENGKPTTVYLPADTYTMEETGVSDGFARRPTGLSSSRRAVETRMTDDNAVKNYSTDGLLNLKAYLREYERAPIWKRIKAITR